MIIEGDEAAGRGPGRVSGEVGGRMAKRKRRLERKAPSTAPRRLPELVEASALLQQKRWAEARDILEALVQRFPRRVDLLSELVNVNYELHDTRAYQRACERLIELTPDDPDLNLGLAGAYLTNVRAFLALRAFRR